MAVRRTLAGLLAAPALLLPAVLAGCGDDSSVADPPVASAPQSVATSDPPARESAEHFIRRWAEAEKDMENTGETGAYSGHESAVQGMQRGGRTSERYYAQRWLHPMERVASCRSASEQQSRQTKGDPMLCSSDSAPTTYQDPSASSALKHLRRRTDHFRV